MTGPHPLLLGPCAGAGFVLAGAFGAVALGRRDRALHAFGDSWAGSLRIEHPAHMGVPLLDEVAMHPVVVRVSRAMSVSHRGPDVIGLGIRFTATAPARDLLLASTGTGRITRHLLRLRTGPAQATLTTLLPLDTAAGATYLRLDPVDDVTWGLSWSTFARPAWRPLGTLELRERVPDPGHFDPTGSAPEGMRVPRWVRALRAPSYRLSRFLLPRLGGPRG